MYVYDRASVDYRGIVVQCIRKRRDLVACPLLYREIDLLSTGNDEGGRNEINLLTKQRGCVRACVYLSGVELKNNLEERKETSYFFNNKR